MRRVGIYPGTFDPVHAGHIAFALGAMQVCGLDEVVFLPERSPRGKVSVTALARRIASLHEALLDGNMRAVELKSDRFTVGDTLPEILRLFGDSELTLLMGSDVARNLRQWEGLDTLFASTALAIGIRGEDDPEEVSGIIRSLEKKHGVAVKHTVVHTEHAHLSSSQFRCG